MLRQLAVLLLIFAGLLSPAMADTRSKIEVVHKGINIIALPVPSDGKFDIKLRSQADAIDALTKSIDLIYAKSKFSVAAFERLKKAGKVTVVYDPDFPKEKLTSVTIAAFFPDFFQKQGNLKEFLVVVGRFGIKWPLEKLAAVLVHELGGHGYQHLRGRTSTDRKIDRECEALLYEEAALQDFSVKRSTPDMIRYRREMQTNWCSDFRRYMRDRDPKLMDLWNFGKPEVSKVLVIFEDYLTHMQKTGISGKAVAAVRQKRLQDLEQMAAQAKRNNSGPDMYAVAQRHFNGIGTPKSIGKARQWFMLSAKAGFPAGQYAMGLIFEHGLAGPQNNSRAYSWHYLAARNGNTKAQQHLHKLSAHLSKAEIEKAKSRANK